jgi:hypothetical protein
MLSYHEISNFLSASGSLSNFGKAAVNTGSEIVVFYGVQTMGSSQKIYFILENGLNLELRENHTLVKLN